MNSWAGGETVMVVRILHGVPAIHVPRKTFAGSLEEGNIMCFASTDGILAPQCLVPDINVFSRTRLNTTTRNVEYDGGLSCRTRTSAPTATLRPNRSADGGSVPARDGYANERATFLRRGGHGATSICWQRSARTCQARCASYRATRLGRRASARPTLRSRCPVELQGSRSRLQ